MILYMCSILAFANKLNHQSVLDYGTYIAIKTNALISLEQSLQLCCEVAHKVVHGEAIMIGMTSLQTYLNQHK